MGTIISLSSDTSGALPRRAEEHVLMNSPTPPAGRSPRFWWVLGSVLVAIAVAATVWFGISATRAAVSTTDIGFERHDRSVTMVFDVDRPVGTTVRCHVKALDEDYATVGSVDVDVPPSNRRSDRQRVTIRTTTRAVTATVDGCSPR